MHVEDATVEHQGGAGLGQRESVPAFQGGIRLIRRIEDRHPLLAHDIRAMVIVVGHYITLTASCASRRASMSTIPCPTVRPVRRASASEGTTPSKLTTTEPCPNVTVKGDDAVPEVSGTVVVIMPARSIPPKDGSDRAAFTGCFTASVIPTVAATT